MHVLASLKLQDKLTSKFCTLSRARSGLVAEDVSAAGALVLCAEWNLMRSYQEFPFAEFKMARIYDFKGLLYFCFFFIIILFHRSYLKEMFSRYRSAAEGVTRSRSLKKTLNTPTAIKKNSHCLQLIYQVVSHLGKMLEKACLIFNQLTKNCQNSFFNKRLYMCIFFYLNKGHNFRRYPEDKG